MCVKRSKYPVYVISKGRWENPLTCRALERMNVPYKVVVEPSEHDNYADKISHNNILVAPENFSQRGQGSVPVRNYVWELAKKTGARRHWILDDNIERFNRMNNNLQHEVLCGSIFRAAEDFVDRYTNVAISGFEYDFFLKSKAKWQPFRTNTRIYSCLLIDNNLSVRWRGKYNEDTDLSLRVLKNGMCTVLFLAFIQQKAQTGTVKGGNEKIYKETDNRKEFAESLKAQHPKLVDVVWKFGRWHHQVNYRPFRRNKLIRVDNYDNIVKDEVDNYGMVLIRKGKA